MAEILTLTSADDQQPTVFEIYTRIPIGLGKEDKFLVEGELEGVLFSVIERFGDKDYIHKWTALKNAGLPVVPNIWVGNEGSVFVTNVKAEGGEVYGKGLSNALVSYTPREFGNTDIDDIFLDLTGDDKFLEIRNAAIAMAILACDNFIQLPFDDPAELLIQPDGSWQLIILDLKYAGIHSNNSGSQILQDIPNLNRINIENFLANIMNIRNELLKRRRANKSWWNIFGE